MKLHWQIFERLFHIVDDIQQYFPTNISPDKFKPQWGESAALQITHEDRDIVSTSKLMKT